MVRSVPVTGWSSPNPLNFRPRLTTLFFLSIGVFFFGLGETLILSAGIGVSPWMVLAQGLGNHLGMSIGVTTFLVSFVVLLAWIPLRQCPGIGTIFNTVIIAATIEFVLPYMPTCTTRSCRSLRLLPAFCWSASAAASIWWRTSAPEPAMA